MFQPVFFETLRLCGMSSTETDAYWQIIQNRYTEPHRFYHNLSHLDHLVSELEPLRQQVHNWLAVVLATAYHDLVYDPLRSDNEAQSAAFAEKQCASFADPFTLQLCVQMIQATRLHGAHADADVNFFTDADLSILGAPQQRYVLYTQQIRQEYQQFPDAVFREGRKKVLLHFLQKDRIFHTGHFFNLYEQAARHNLQNERDLLS